jgi:hypothetical protein
MGYDLGHMYELDRPFFRPTRATRKDLAAIAQDEVVQRARQEAAARTTAHRVAAEEQIRLAQAQFRVNGVYSLAQLGSQRATELNRAIDFQSRGNPGLEAIHRAYEETAAVVSNHIIYNYGIGQ